MTRHMRDPIIAIFFQKSGPSKSSQDTQTMITRVTKKEMRTRNTNSRTAGCLITSGICPTVSGARRTKGNAKSFWWMIRRGPSIKAPRSQKLPHHSRPRKKPKRVSPQRYIFFSQNGSQNPESAFVQKYERKVFFRKACSSRHDWHNHKTQPGEENASIGHRQCEHPPNAAQPWDVSIILAIERHRFAQWRCMERHLDSHRITSGSTWVQKDSWYKPLVTKKRQAKKGLKTSSRACQNWVCKMLNKVSNIYRFLAVFVTPGFSASQNHLDPTMWVAAFVVRSEHPQHRHTGNPPLPSSLPWKDWFKLLWSSYRSQAGNGRNATVLLIQSFGAKMAATRRNRFRFYRNNRNSCLSAWASVNMEELKAEYIIYQVM